MDRKERIYSYISSSAYVPLKLAELETVLDVPKEDKEKFAAILCELEREGRIFVTKRGRYIPAPCDMVPGTLRCNAGSSFAFADPDEKTDGKNSGIFIGADKMNGALNGDRVLVCIEERAFGESSAQGRVVKVLERANKHLSGIVEKAEKGYFRIKPDDKKIHGIIKIRPDNMMNAASGDRVISDITHVDEKGNIYGRVSANLGKSKDLNSLINAVIYAGGVNPKFSEEALAEAGLFPESIKEEDISDRLDLRDEKIFTIDGDDAKDFDDAVGIKKLEHGWRLGIHIADVSHYVKENTALDKDAFERGTSIYLPGRVIPMLPEKLSNGLCSLRPDEDRLTLSVIMEIDTGGKVISHTLAKSIIRSKYRLTYDNVTKLLEGDSELCCIYSDIADDLREMQRLAGILTNMRKNRGAVSFNFPESRIKTDENCRPVEIGIQQRGISNKIIEEFMLTANETIAEYAYWAELPFVYRVHEPPSFDKLTAFKKYAAGLGYHLKESFDKATPIHPKTLETLISTISGKPEERAISRTLLQSLMKAEYSPKNLGHFGLAAKYYCHFTSPIRRYPDLAIHRILKSIISGTSEKKLAAFEAFAERAAKHSSDAEVRAQEIERRAEDIMKAYYMHGFIGKSFTGTVSGTASFGMFVELDNTVEGLVRMIGMTDDYYEYNESDMTLTGKRFGEVFSVGDRVHVRLTGCDVTAGQIEFELKGRDIADANQ